MGADLRGDYVLSGVCLSLEDAAKGTSRYLIPGDVVRVFEVLADSPYAICEVVTDGRSLPFFDEIPVDAVANRQWFRRLPSDAWRESFDRWAGSSEEVPCHLTTH